VIEVFFAFERQKGKQVVSQVKSIKLLKKAARIARLKNAYISVAVVSDATIRKLNTMYRGAHKPTDVLSFASRDETTFPKAHRQFLGDIILDWQEITRRAKHLRISTKKLSQFLLVHGLLHLAGHDHIGVKDRARMRRLEKRISGSDTYYE
jgi:rRNA maturation RNase YbeY